MRKTCRRPREPEQKRGFRRVRGGAGEGGARGNDITVNSVRTAARTEANVKGRGADGPVFAERFWGPRKMHVIPPQIRGGYAIRTFRICSRFSRVLCHCSAGAMAVSHSGTRGVGLRRRGSIFGWVTRAGDCRGKCSHSGGTCGSRKLLHIFRHRPMAPPHPPLRAPDCFVDGGYGGRFRLFAALRRAFGVLEGGAAVTDVVLLSVDRRDRERSSTRRS